LWDRDRVTNPYGGPPITQFDAHDAEELREVDRGAGFFTELGTTGLKRAAGYVDEEFLPQLRGRKAVQVYREMGDNDPIVGALLFAIIQLLRNVDWPVMPGGKNHEDGMAAKLVETAKDDMSHSWGDMIVEICSMLQYGWSWHEPVMKRRIGPWEKDGRRRSQYTDGLIGWRKIPIRAQETLMRWSFDPNGDVNGMYQLAPPDYQVRPLPISRGLLFRNGAHKGNPEGRSLLRNAYRPWYYKKRMEEYESIGGERDLAGLPMIKVPSSYLKARPGTDQYKMVEAFKKLVRSIRRNEQEGLVFPTAYDAETRQPMFEFELLGSGGARQFSTDTLIQRYEQRILMTCLADWIMVGHESSGTYNMHIDKRGAFQTSLNAIIKSVADVFNRHAIPRLFAANGWRPQRLPRFQPSDVDSPDLTQLAQFLGATSQLGYTWGPDADLEQWLRRVAGMPELGTADYEKRRVEARKEEATRYAEEQLRYLATRSQLAETISQQKMTAAGMPDVETTQAAGQAEQAQQQGEQQNQQAQAQQGIANQQGADTNRRAEEQHQMGMAQAAAGEQNGKSSATKKVGKSDRRERGAVVLVPTR
jgi:hypothetical protein